MELLYDQTYGTARTVAESIVGPDSSEDVAMETMIRASQRLDDGMPLEEVAELIPMIAYGLAVDEYRSRGREVSAGIGQDDPLGALLDARAVNDFEAAMFTNDHDSGVRDLPDDEQSAYILTDLRGLTVREAAGALRAPTMTVHDRAASARAKIREGLAA